MSCFFSATHPQPARPVASALPLCWSSLALPGIADPAELCTSSPTHPPTRKLPHKEFSFPISRGNWLYRTISRDTNKDQSRGHIYRAEVNNVQVPLLSLGLAFLPGFLEADFSHWQQTSHAEASLPDQHLPANRINIKNLYSP